MPLFSVLLQAEGLRSAPRQCVCLWDFRKAGVEALGLYYFVQVRDLGTGMGKMVPSHLNEPYVTSFLQQPELQKQISLPNYVLFRLILKIGS